MYTRFERRRAAPPHPAPAALIHCRRRFCSTAAPLTTAAVVDALEKAPSTAAQALSRLQRSSATHAVTEPELLLSVLTKLGRSGRTATLLDVLDWMRKEESAARGIDRRHFNAAIRGLVGAQEAPNAAVRLLQLMRDDGFAPNRTSYTAAMCALASRGSWQEAAQLLDAMRAAGFEPEVTAVCRLRDLQHGQLGAACSSKSRVRAS